MKFPPTEQIDLAVMWLESNTGDGPEGEACKAVAAWLDWKNRELYLQHEARAGGIPVAVLRRKIAEMGKR